MGSVGFTIPGGCDGMKAMDIGIPPAIGIGTIDIDIDIPTLRSSILL